MLQLSEKMNRLGTETAFEVLARELADEEHHRRAVLHRHMHAGAGIGGAGSVGDKADAGGAGELAMGLGHHRRAAFLAADEGADAVGTVERVEHGEIGFAGHAEDAVDAVGLERLDDQLSAGLHAFFFSSSASISLVCSPRRGEGRS